MPSYDSQGRLKIVNANSASTGSGGGAIAIASGSSGIIVDTDATFINFQGSAVSSVALSGSGVTVTIVTASSAAGTLGATGWNASSNYLSAPGAFSGGDNFGLLALVNIGRLQAVGTTGGPYAIVSSGNRFFEGLSLWLESDRAWAERTNAGTKATLGGNRWYEAAGATAGAALAFLDDQMMMVGIRHTGDGSSGTFQLLVNGIVAGSFVTSGAFTPSTGTGYVGRQTNAFDAFNGAIVAIGYLSGAMSDDVIWDSYQFARRNGTLPTGVFTNRYVFTEEGTVGATVPDTEGSIDLTTTGTLTVVYNPRIGGGGVTDHGALTGLEDDDHTQYLHVSGTRPMSGDLNMGSNNIIISGTVDGRNVSVDGAKLDTIDAGAQVIAILSGSLGEIVTSSIDFINFDGTGVESVHVTGSGVTVTINGGSGGITIASGSSGTIVDSNATFINFQGSAVSSVAISGSGVTVNVNHTPYADFLTGFGEGATDTDRNVWQLTNDPLSGSANWAVGVICVKTNMDIGDDSQRIWSTQNQYLGDGVTFAVHDAVPRFYLDNGSFFQVDLTSIGFRSRNYVHFCVAVYRDGNIEGYINGIPCGFGGSFTGEGYPASGFPFTVGGSAEGNSSYAAEAWGVHSICYVTRSLTNTEVMNWWRHVYVSGTLVDIPTTSSNGLNGAWRVTAEANPSGATWAPFIGADNLIKTGSKAHSIESLPLIWV